MEYELRTESLESLIAEGYSREGETYVQPVIAESFFNDQLNLFAIIKEQMLEYKKTCEIEASKSLKRRRENTDSCEKSAFKPFKRTRIQSKIELQQ
jgi:hypothetical protein